VVEEEAEEVVEEEENLNLKELGIRINAKLLEVEGMVLPTMGKEELVELL